MNIQEQIEYLSRGTTEIISTGQLKAKLEQSSATATPLKIKAGFDPTAPDLHLGHVVLLHKLRQFQNLGHEVYFLIGDFTAQIGDPTGKDKLRPKLNLEQIIANAASYKEQVFKVLDPEKTQVVFNSAWLDKMGPREILGLTRYSTVAQMLVRADFKKRIEEAKEISILEFIYPLLQGYDSVHLKADVELGGNDQKFNLLMGRQMQEAFDQEPQVVLMTPLLEGIDGAQKMSKSLGNYIGVSESPKEIFGKVMSVSDELMLRYFQLLTDHNMEGIRQMHPKEAKMLLARNLVAKFYDQNSAENEQKEFERTFSQGLMPEHMQEFQIEGGNVGLADVLLKAEIVKSKNEVRRLIKEGAVSFEGAKIDSESWEPRRGILKIGKKRFLRIV